MSLLITKNNLNIHLLGCWNPPITSIATSNQSYCLINLCILHGKACSNFSILHDCMIVTFFFYFLNKKMLCVCGHKHLQWCAFAPCWSLAAAQPPIMSTLTRFLFRCGRNMEVYCTLGVWLEYESILRKLPRVSEVTTNHLVFLRCDWSLDSIWFYYQS